MTKGLNVFQKLLLLTMAMFAFIFIFSNHRICASQNTNQVWLKRLSSDGYVFQIAKNGHKDSNYKNYYIVDNKKTKNSTTRRYTVSNSVLRKLAYGKEKFKVYSVKNNHNSVNVSMKSRNNNMDYTFAFANGGAGSGIVNSNSYIKELRPLIKQEISAAKSVNNKHKSIVFYNNAKNITNKISSRNKKIAANSLKELKNYINNPEMYNLPTILVGLMN
ncbi:hypothetical protein [Apilactobacillus xinyiensis]|uniref:hypothetical protein n=1 Tax=Apilactobacillus xinyiensis TaxID=2841032 RepID=UPI001C7D72B2|nr:hypothetical protein [Apilactobacillus xinyiensis]